MRLLRSGFALMLLSLLPEAATAQARLFVASEPFGATITIDGDLRESLTPSLLTLPPGSYDVVLNRENHVAESSRVDLQDGEVGHVSLELEAQYVLLEAPEEPEAERLALPTGGYDVRRDAGELYIQPRYPRERSLEIARTLVPTSIIVAVLFSGWSALAPPENPSLSVAPVVTAQLFAAGSAALTGVLALDRDRYLRRWAPPRDPYLPISANRALAEARELLERGDIANAQEQFRALIREHPAAPGVPEALYTLGQLALIDGELTEAGDYLETIIESYPVIEYYDRSLVQLARVAREQNQADRALGYLDLITYSDPNITPESVEALRRLIGG